MKYLVCSAVCSGRYTDYSIQCSSVLSAVCSVECAVDKVHDVVCRPISLWSADLYLCQTTDLTANLPVHSSSVV